MNRSILIFLLIFNISAFGQNHKELEKSIIPDSTINNQIIIMNDLSVLKTFGYIWNLVLRDPHRIYFVNKSGTEYLKMTFHSGNSENQFSEFEIGDISLIPENEPINKSNFEGFYTESGIRLGITKNELIKIKGKNFIAIKNEHNLEGIRYNLESDYDGYDYIFKYEFLERYGYPSYYAFYWFKNNKLVKFEFGFEYV